MTTHRERALGQARADLLREVAEVYETAVKRKEPPTVAVETTMHMPRSTASRWIAAAREANLITVTWDLRRSAKLAAVAAELGVSEEKLRQAIRRHASGRLVV